MNSSFYEFDCFHYLFLCDWVHLLNLNIPAVQVIFVADNHCRFSFCRSTFSFDFIRIFFCFIWSFVSIIKRIINVIDPIDFMCVCVCQSQHLFETHLWRISAIDMPSNVQLKWNGSKKSFFLFLKRWIKTNSSSHFWNVSIMSPTRAC